MIGGRDDAGYWTCEMCPCGPACKRGCEADKHNRATLFKASWERMVLYAAIFTARSSTDPYYFSGKLEQVSDGPAYEQFQKEAWGQ